MYILSIDQSTSGTKVIIFDERANLIHKVIEYHKQYYPEPGWVEHDPVEIFSKTLEASQRVIEESGIDKSKIEGISITNQRETTVLWEKNTGVPFYNAVVWQCQRGKEICDDLKEKGLENFIRERTGLFIDPYFSASKIKWIFENVKGVKEKAEKGKALFGTIDSWLIWNLTNGEVHATDHSNASRTLLLNIKNITWDEEILRVLSIPVSILPELKNSDDVFGYTDLNRILPRKVPIVGVMGDSSASLFGLGGFEEGEIKATYGTGTSIMLNIGNNFFIPKTPVVTSICWSINNAVYYSIEGNIHSSGDTIAWLIKNLELIDSPYEAEKFAKSLESTEGVYFVPAFVGLGAPYWRNDVRATILGLSKNSTKAHVVRAALESIAYQVRDLLEVMISETNHRPLKLKVDGGASENRFLMQFQANILGMPVMVSKIKENSARGVALLGLLKFGKFSSLLDMKKAISEYDIYEPSLDQNSREKLYNGWKRAVNTLLKN